jgi:hypothetical protein
VKPIFSTLVRSWLAGWLGSKGTRRQLLTITFMPTVTFKNGVV